MIFRTTLFLNLKDSGSCLNISPGELYLVRLESGPNVRGVTLNKYYKMATFIDTCSGDYGVIVNNAQCGVGRFHECCTMGWARTGSTEELCFKLFFELKRGKRLFLMLGFLPSQPSVWNIRRTKRLLLLKAADEMNIRTHGLEFAHRAHFLDERKISVTDTLGGGVLLGERCGNDCLWAEFALINR